MRTRRLPGATSEVVAFCASLPGPKKVAYEAGPTGYGLARAVHAAGIGCVVAAPGKIKIPGTGSREDRPARRRAGAAAADDRRLARRAGSQLRGGGAARPRPRHARRCAAI